MATYINCVHEESGFFISDDEDLTLNESDSVFYFATTNFALGVEGLI